MLIKRLHCGPEGDLTTSRWPTRLPGDDLRQSLEGVHLLLGQDADQGDHRHRDSWVTCITCITCITWCSDISPSVLMILLTSRLGGVAGWGNYLYWSCIPAVAALLHAAVWRVMCRHNVTWPSRDQAHHPPDNNYLTRPHVASDSQIKETRKNPHYSYLLYCPLWEVSWSLMCFRSRYTFSGFNSYDNRQEDV